MKEQEQRSLEGLHKERNRISRALEKVYRVSQTIGTSAFEGHSNLNERFDLSRFSGEEFLDPADRVGKVIEALQEGAKPKLVFQKEKAEREIGNFDRIQKVEEQVERIRQFVKKAYLPESALEKAERVLANLAQSFTPPSISAEEKRLLTLPDGQVIDNLKPLESVMVAKLLGFSEENPIASSEIARLLYGDKVPINVAKHRLSVLISAVRKKLAGVGWKVDREFRRVVGAVKRSEAWYYLAEEGKAEEKEPEGSSEMPPESLTEEPRELVLPDGKIISNLTNPEFQLVEKLMVYSEENAISSSEIVRFLYGDKVDIKVGLDQLFVMLFRTRMKLWMVGWSVVGERFRVDLETGRVQGWYHLAPAPVDEEVEQSEDKETVKKVGVKKRKEDLELPDGKKLTSIGRKQKVLIEGLLCGSQEKPVATSELAEMVYGEAVPKDTAVSRIHSNMKNVKKKLNSVGWEIVNLTPSKGRFEGKEALYYLSQKKAEDVVEEKPTDGQEEIPTTIEFAGAPSTLEPEEVIIPVVESVFSETPKQSATPSLSPGEVGKLGEEITIVPYIPTEEERRTQEETRILDVIASSLLNETRMRFEQIQAQLFSGDRTKPLVGGEAVFIYQAQELIERFSSAFRKMREEAAIGALSETWDDKEKEIWNKLESLRTKFQVTEVRDFLRRVSEEIRRSERQFYTDYPAERGNKVTWVRKDNR